MIANDLQHLFNGTHCLSKRQLRDYAAGSISREEAYAVESHLNTCPLCSAAADGMLAHFPESAGVLAEVDAGFLKEHFKKHSPQIHLNTVAPAAAAAPATRRIPGGRTIELTSLRTMGVAAGVLLLIASLWWMQTNTDRAETSLEEGAPIAQADAPGTSSSSPGGAPESESRLARASAVAKPQEANREVAESDKKVAAPQGAVVNEVATMTRSASFSASPAPQATAAAPVQKAKAAQADGTDDAAAEQKTDEVAVRARRYQRPLIEPAQPGARSVLSDKEIEKTPTRNPLDAASTAPGVYKGRSGSGVSIGGGRGENTTYVVDGVVKAPPADGKALYKKGSYIEALKVFRTQLSKSSGAEHEEAMLYAARCHRALGQSTSAKKLLQELAAGTGARARAARRELRSMGVATADDAADKSR